MTESLSRYNCYFQFLIQFQQDLPSTDRRGVLIGDYFCKTVIKLIHKLRLIIKVRDKVLTKFEDYY